MSTAAALQAWIDVDATERHLRVMPVVGDIVERDGVRGIVMRPGCPLNLGDFEIRLGAGHTRVSNNIDAWRIIPFDEATPADRIRSLAESWTPEEGDDSFEWHLLAALVPRALLDRWTNGAGDWPDVVELALAAAEQMTKRARAEGRPT